MNKSIIDSLSFFLFFWYILSIFLCMFDKTLTLNTKVIGEIINISMIYLSACSLSNDFYQKKYKFNKILATLDLFWFLFYSYVDISNSGYSNFEALLYTGVDELSIIFLIIIINNKKLQTNFNIVTDLLIIKKILINSYVFRKFFRNK